ncbi:MAG: RimK family alpha-L-glutamate ligase [Burkholderiales bacterium]|nr:RimK family alpha-L-glutamate ligase [Burkholderiales bacterium]
MNLQAQTARPEPMYYPAAREERDLIGLPRLMEMCFRGLDLTPLRDRLVLRAERDPEDANALLDLSTILFLRGRTELALRMQAEALAIRRVYTLAATGPERLRAAMLMTPGDLMANMPIEFLLHGSDVTLDLEYLDPAQPLQAGTRAAVDVACLAVCESPAARPLLAALARAPRHAGVPQLNDAARVLALARESLWRVLAGVPGCLVPPSVRADRAALAALARGESDLDALLPGGAFPLICRPLGSHAGHGLARIADRDALAVHLGANAGDDFVISNFVDYAGADGQYRKVRLSLVGGRAWPVHLAISARWMVHYLNGDMADRADNRAEEQRFLDGFETGFARRHAAALAALDERLGLDYCSVDCAETRDGRLLIFECDTGGVAHAMDPLQDYGYKRPHMLRLFAAFRDLLAQAARDPACLKPKTKPGTAALS